MLNHYVTFIGPNRLDVDDSGPLRASPISGNPADACFVFAIEGSKPGETI
jgi:hypothetical protein